MPTQGDLILRLLLATALAGALGTERELTDQPAGFRTHILVGLGAALFAIVSAFGFQSIAGLGPTEVVRADVTRVASQIVVGIGFLGGGAILKYGASVRGLTTAASLWVTAAIGTAVGLGALLLGTITTIVTLLALVGLRPARSLLRRYAVGADEFVLEASRKLHLEAVVDRLRAAGDIQELRMREDEDGQVIRILVRLQRNVRPADVASDLARLDEVRGVDWGR